MRKLIRIINAGGKRDYTISWWNHARYQAVDFSGMSLSLPLLDSRRFERSP